MERMVRKDTPLFSTIIEIFLPGTLLEVSIVYQTVSNSTHYENSAPGEKGAEEHYDLSDALGMCPSAEQHATTDVS